ncbi:hypothetical protein RZS08_56240, partial [Arthrospira platensis SPKY1]|nr:hypothetical protein [Arthrospira platensis SPKY1]
ERRAVAENAQQLGGGEQAEPQQQRNGGQHRHIGLHPFADESDEQPGQHQADSEGMSGLGQHGAER